MNEAETRGLARQGRGAWNDWAKRHLETASGEECTVRFDSWTNHGVRDFSGFIFPGPVCFAGQPFVNGVDFSSAVFHGRVECLEDVQFGGEAVFAHATFHQGAVFAHATFHQGAGFTNAEFHETAQFGSAAFRGPASFRSTEFKKDVFFCPCKIPEPSKRELQDKKALRNYISKRVNAECWTQFHNKVDFSHATFHLEAQFTCASFLEQADFESTTFKNAALFSWDLREMRKVNDYGGQIPDLPLTATKFHGGVTFRHANFGIGTWFRNAEFMRHASFIDADFAENVSFRYARFHGFTQFLRTNFQFANFEHAQFLPRHPSKSEQTAPQVHRYRDTVERTRTNAVSSDVKDGAMFRGATFESVASFEDAKFEVDTNFQGCVVHTYFEMMQDVLPNPPDFTQAVFLAAPNFGDAEWPERLSRRKRIGLPLVRRRARELDASNEQISMTPRWRALKRLAVQGRDHHNARLFYRGEMLGMLEDSRRKRAANVTRGTKERMSALDPIRNLYGLFSDFGCSIGRPVAWWVGTVALFSMAFFLLTGRNSDCLLNALALSVKHSLPGFSSGLEVETRVSCLNLRSPWTVFLGAVQNVLSATFIFLFLLGLRNRFRM